MNDTPKNIPKNSPLREGSQCLLEMKPSTDPSQPGCQYTKAQAAQMAQIKKWKRLMRSCKPRTNITSDMLADRNNSPPFLFYGWPFKEDYLVDYAKRHRLSFETDTKHQEWLGCPTLEFNFADVTDDHYKSEKVANYLRIMARITVLPVLMRRSKHPLWIGRPFSFKYSDILYMWTNYNIDEECDDCGQPERYDKVIGFLDTAMNECLPEGQKSKLQWWWSWDDNDLNILGMD